MGLQDPITPLFPFIRNLRAVFHLGCTLVHPAQSAGGFRFPYVLCSIFSLEIFLMMAILTGGRGFLSVDLISIDLIMSGSSLVWLSSKESACNAEHMRDVDLIPVSGRSLKEEMATHSSILS